MSRISRTTDKQIQAESRWSLTRLAELKLLAHPVETSVHERWITHGGVCPAERTRVLYFRLTEAKPSATGPWIDARVLIYDDPGEILPQRQRNVSSNRFRGPRSGN